MAITERTIPNTRHAIGNRHGGKVLATLERAISNTRHAIGDIDGSGRTAVSPDRY